MIWHYSLDVFPKKKNPTLLETNQIAFAPYPTISWDFFNYVAYTVYKIFKLNDVVWYAIWKKKIRGSNRTAVYMIFLINFLLLF